MTKTATETTKMTDDKIVLRKPPETWDASKNRQGRCEANLAWQTHRNAWIKQEFSAGQNEEWIALMLQEVGAPLSTARIWQVATEYDDNPAVKARAKARAKAKVRKTEDEVVCLRRTMVKMRGRGVEEADGYARRIIKAVVAMRTEVEAEFAGEDTLARLMGGVH